jgi:hypothetical protein
MFLFKTWDELLHRYVDSQGRVDYRAWQKQSQEKLTNWLTEIAQSDLASIADANQKLALWLNLYNALAIAQVLKVYPIASIRPTIFGIPNWIAFIRFFRRSIYRIGDRRFSLDDIEHGILRPEYRDPRLHFALVCASAGCPWLRREAYLSETVQTQLEDDAKRFINNPTKIYYDERSQTLYCSRILKWYGRDFLAVADSLPKYLQSYLENITLSPSPRIRFLPYDWKLNNTER